MSKKSKYDYTIGFTDCCICFNESASLVFLPCGHICMCEKCFKRYKRKLKSLKVSCPICNTNIKNIKIVAKRKVLKNMSIKYDITCKLCNGDVNGSANGSSTQNQVNILALPCKHITICDKCYNNRRTRKCNTCKLPIRKTYKVYIV